MTLEDALALVKTFRSCAGLPLNPLELDEFDAAKKIRTHFLNQKSGQSSPTEDSGIAPAAPDSKKCLHSRVPEVWDSQS